MWLHWLRNVMIVLFILSIVAILFLVVCRKSSHFKGLDSVEDKNIFNAFFNRLYFIVTTITTIGYGDITPFSFRAKLLTILMILFIVIAIMKAFDSLIDVYKKQFGKYFSGIPILGNIDTQEEKVK